MLIEYLVKNFGLTDLQQSHDQLKNNRIQSVFTKSLVSELSKTGITVADITELLNTAILHKETE